MSELLNSKFKIKRPSHCSKHPNIPIVYNPLNGTCSICQSILTREVLIEKYNLKY